MYVLQNFLIKSTDHLSSAHPSSQYHAQYDLAMIFNFLIENAVLTQQNDFLRTTLNVQKSILKSTISIRYPLTNWQRLPVSPEDIFFRKFKSQFHVSPLAYQQAIRIEAAKTLLKTTVLRCNEVAWRVGFSDVYFFHRVFKKHIRLTPVQYRKKPK
jgi:hypothetical protein